MNGPWKDSETQKFIFYMTYHYNKNVYPIDFEEVMKWDDLDVHELVLENYDSWGPFKKYFLSKATPIEPFTGKRGVIMYNDGTYICVDWFPEKKRLFAWPGFEDRVAIFGGKRIDSKRPIQENGQLNFLDEDIEDNDSDDPDSNRYFVYSGSQYELVIDPDGATDLQIVYAVNEHVASINALSVLEPLFASVLNRLLRPRKSNEGKKYNAAFTISHSVWTDGILPAFKRMGLPLSRRNGIYRFGLTYNEAIGFFRANMFSREYYSCRMYCSNNIFRYNPYVCRLSSTGYILRKNFDGKANGGADKLPNELREDDWATLWNFDKDIVDNILSGLRETDVSNLRCVSSRLSAKLTPQPVSERK